MAFLLLSTVLSLAAQETIGLITCRVAARDGTLLTRVTVSLDNGKQGMIARADGSFTLIGIAAGERQLVVSHIDHTPFKITMAVRADVTEQVEIILDKHPTGSTIVVNAPRVEYRPRLSSTALKPPRP